MAPRDGVDSRSPISLKSTNSHVDALQDVIRRADSPASEPAEGADGASPKDEAENEGAGVAPGSESSEPKDTVGGNVGAVESQIQDLEQAKKLLDDAKSAYDAQIQKLKSTPAGENEISPDI